MVVWQPRKSIYIWSRKGIGGEQFSSLPIFVIRNLLKFIHIYDKIFLTMKCKEVMKVKNQRPKPAKASKWIRIAIYIILAFLVVRSELIKVGVLPGASEQNYSAIEEYGTG